MSKSRNHPFTQANILAALSLAQCTLDFPLHSCTTAMRMEQLLSYPHDRQGGTNRWTQRHTHTIHSLLDNLAGYSSEDGLEHNCLSVDFKLDTLEVPSYKPHLCSEYKCYHKCPNVMRHLPHHGFTSVVHSYLLIWCPPLPPKVDVQRRVHQITILNMHTY